MAFDLTPKTLALSQQINVEPVIIVEIDGIDFKFGSQAIGKTWLVGNDANIGDAGLVIGGIIEDPESRALVSLIGTTNNITQQLEVDDGGTGSVQKFNVELLDKDGELTKLFSLGDTVPDMLARETNVYLGFNGGAHPEDSIRLFNGTIDSQEVKSGTWNLGVAHPESLKRQELFIQAISALDGGITAGATTLTLDSTDGLLTPADTVTCHVQIGDELIEYTGISSNDLTGLTRGALGTVAATHADDDESVSFYVIDDRAIDVALKMMLSNTGNTDYETDVSATRFIQVDSTTQIVNGIFFPDFTIQDDLGLNEGDFISITGASNGANNFTDRTISSFVDISTGTVMVVDGAALVIETNSSALASFRSQFNVYPDGAGCSMKPTQVDVAQHLEIDDIFGSTFPSMSLFIKDTITAKDFIIDELYKPTGLYQAPRKGRVSLATTSPPLVLGELVSLTSDNVKNANTLNIKRQLTKNFFNNIVYKFNINVLDDKFLAGQVTFSARSQNQIPTGTKSLTIESSGLRDNLDTRNFITKQSRFYTDRYQFAAESIKVEPNFKSSFNIEVTDIVLFGDDDLQVGDILNGTRKFEPRLFECINKSMNIKTGAVTLELLDTRFEQDGRFGVVGPSSFIDSGATTINIPLKASFSTGVNGIEREKYRSFIGEEIRVHSADFTFDETVTLNSFSAGNIAIIIVDPPLSSPPTEDFIVDLAQYDTGTDSNVNSNSKAIHCFFNPQLTVLSGASDTEFTVSLSDAARVVVEGFVRVHSFDFTDDSAGTVDDDDPAVLTVDIGTGVITVDKSLTFTPSSGDLVDLVGFLDQGLPYRVL